MLKLRITSPDNVLLHIKEENGNLEFTQKVFETQADFMIRVKGCLAWLDIFEYELLMKSNLDNIEAIN
jgi:hypothetical protein